MAKKLILTRDDGPDRVLEALEASRESALTVVAPRGSSLADREGLAKIGEAAAERGIAVAIESVDEELLSLAHAAHLETVHPFFRADRRHLSLDGIVKNDVQHPRVPVHAEKGAHDTPVKVSPEQYEMHQHPLPTPVSSRPSVEAQPAAREGSGEPAGEHGDAGSRPALTEDQPRKGGRRVSKVRLAVTALVAVALVVGVGEGFFRGGSVSVTLAETPWEYTATVTAATSVTTSTVGTMSIPGQLFPEQNRSIAQSFAATGAPGAGEAPAASKPRVTVYNESLSAETFVVRTRFQGKSGIFRAASAVAIPAAKRDGDKLTPGSATVEVTPESAAVLSGASDGERLTVPGLAGTDKESLFYATLSKPKEESAAAEPSVPPSERVVTSADEEGARTKITEMLASSHRVKVIAQAPGLTVIDGAVTVEPTQLTVNKDVDEQGNFNVVGQANVTALAFREEDLKELLLQQAATQAGISYPTTFRSIEIAYADVAPQFADGRMTFTVTAKAVIVGQITEESLRAESAGKSRGDVATWLKNQSAVKEASVSVRPFWRFKLPAEAGDVGVEIR